MFGFLKWLLLTDIFQSLHVRDLSSADTQISGTEAQKISAFASRFDVEGPLHGANPRQLQVVNHSRTNDTSADGQSGDLLTPSKSGDSGQTRNRANEILVFVVIMLAFVGILLIILDRGMPDTTEKIKIMRNQQRFDGIMPEGTDNTAAPDGELTLFPFDTGMECASSEAMARIPHCVDLNECDEPAYPVEP